MIELKNVTKQYAGQPHPAVDNLTLTVPEGEICVLVGPSGCGKSTTLRMINRMIEPSAGSITINGQSVMNNDPDHLRMGIGYVIQQIGLLPHRTIAENIAIVPRLYKWPKDKIVRRVDELLAMMGLDPEKTRSKYPSQLSGGQMQRVGVARAMAVDPPIMLMDEPFGAVDPIARTHLQDEFLRLQREIRKTIVFVTHDINEAIKMGDKIAIFGEGKLVQFGTPEEVLTNPADEFVENFIGYDRIVKKLFLYQVQEAYRPAVCRIRPQEIGNALSKMRAEQAEVAFVLDEADKLYGYLTREELEQEETVRDAGGLHKLAASRSKAFVQTTTPLPDALSVMLEYDTEYVGVLKNGLLEGVMSFKDIRRHVYRREGE